MLSHGHKSLLVTSTILGLTTAWAALSPATAATSTVHCGDVLTTNTTLTKSLTCGPDSDGLSIGADGVKLNLGGHKITGPGAYATSFAGVRVAGHTGVKIEKGTIIGFQAGVVLDEATGALVSKLSVHDNDQGINLAGGRDHVIEKNKVYDNGRDGIRLGLSAHNRISKNKVADNTFGINLADGSSDNVVEQNDVTRTEGDGISIGGDVTGSSLLKNDVSRNGGDGIHADAAGTTVTKNDAQKNAGYGIYAPGAVDGGGNKAKGNGGPVQCEGVVCK